MSNQYEITKANSLLNPDGTLTEEGWAKELLLEYDREAIAAKWFRIKEWDYYYAINHQEQYGITFTMSDLGYIGLMAVVWLDFKKKEFYPFDTMSFLPRHKTGFPNNSSEGKINYKDKKMELKYEYNLPKREITINAPKFQNKKGLKGHLTLEQPSDLDSIVIATSWKENRKAFYYNQKINCLPVEGEIIIGDKKYTFDKSTSMGGLDWGRGRWTHKNRWFWGSASGYQNNMSIGWNLGYGFSDRSPASENAVFYNNKIHKIDLIEFHFDKENYLKPWKVTSNDGRFEMNFTPILDRNSTFNLLVLKSIQHQVFGYYTGTIILDNGKEIKIDRMLGFAEDVLNWW